MPLIEEHSRVAHEPCGRFRIGPGTRELHEVSVVKERATSATGPVSHRWEQREELTRRGESEALKAAGMRTAERGVSQIEQLLEVIPRGDLAARVAALQPFFSR